MGIIDELLDNKLIQLPFMMPMGEYDIGNYVT